MTDSIKTCLWLLERHNIKPTCIYRYGSRVYGVGTEQSDHDFIVVADTLFSHQQLASDGCDVTVYSETEFLTKLRDHDISAIECVSQPFDPLLCSKDYRLHLNIGVLRNAISSKASNSFVKAKKKMMAGPDYAPYVGKKSLFHSLRILMFGIQIAECGRVVDFTAANRYWDEIVKNDCNDWEHYKAKYQPIYNSLSSKFRECAPKR